MITRRGACFLILVVALESVSAFHCSTNCICELKNYHEDIWINCLNEDDPMFNVTIELGQSVDIYCESSEWSYRSRDGTILIRNETIKSMYYMCELPRNNSLGEIARILKATHVEKLDITLPSNMISTSNRHFLCDFENLKKLDLNIDKRDFLNKSYKHVDDQINWTQLNLTKRKLHLDAEFFKCTPGLEQLSLNNNNELMSFELDTFDNLKNLTEFGMNYCVLNELQSGIFDELDVLESLSLSNSGIVRLPEDIFAKLKNLNFIGLDYNDFIYIPKKLLQNNRKLHIFFLFKNKRNITTLPNEFFANLTKLETVSLYANGFVTLPEDLFWGCTSLTNIALQENSLQALPVHIFRDLKELKQLILNFNRIETLPDYIFSNTNKLTVLDLSKNRITSISEHLFNGLYALKILNVTKNQLVTISHYGFNLLKSLEIAELSDNHLSSEYLNSRTFYASCEALDELHLDNNNISEIFFNRIYRRSQLQKLSLSYNNITSITVSKSEENTSKVDIDTLDFLNIITLNMKVDLTYNKIKHIFLHNMDSLRYNQYSNKYLEIFVDNNPLHCDCQLDNFLRYIKDRITYINQYRLDIRLDGLTCQNPKELENVPVIVWRPNLSVCKTAVAISNCPKKCNCLGSLQDNTFIFDCSQRNLTSVPSDIKKPDNHTRFELNFSGNRLTHMPDLKAMELESVKKLILSHNSISEISLDGLSSTIEVLELHNNNLSRIHPDVLEFLKQSTNLTRLTLHENPWECDCDAKEFQSLIRNQTKNVTIPDLLKVKCVGSNVSISKTTLNDFCPVNTTTIIGISIAISLGILIGFFGLYYKYERQIKVWLFAHQSCLWFVTEEELDKEKLYDAFVSYSHKDHDFVVSKLVPELENGLTPFKLCLHFRDWVVGEWIPTNINSSVENSKRTIVVLSPNFLESVWGRLEFRAAHSQALNEGRARVILILYGDIGPTDNLDPELKAYVNMNTYITWGDPWFWDKLKYALPHQPKLVRHSADRNKISEYHQLSIQTNGDQGCQN